MVCGYVECVTGKENGKERERVGKREKDRECVCNEECKGGK
jgi:hypothetical protein